MTTTAHQAPGDEIVIDARQILPRQRHPLIFDTFARLVPGQAFLLVNDHDPKPLYYQFKAEQDGTFEWTYLEQGPEVWQVRIARTRSAQAREPGHTA